MIKLEHYNSIWKIIWAFYDKIVLTSAAMATAIETTNEATMTSTTEMSTTKSNSVNSSTFEQLINDIELNKPFF